MSFEKANFPLLGTVEKSERQEQTVIRIVNIKSSEKGRIIFLFFCKNRKNLIGLGRIYKSHVEYAACFSILYLFFSLFLQSIKIEL